MHDSTFIVRREIEAAKLIVEGLREVGGAGDPVLVADTIEGETGLVEAVDRVVAEIDETEIFITGLKEKEAQFQNRRRAMEERVKRYRGLVEQAMAVADQTRLRRPCATLTLRKLPPDLIVLSEADIPSYFFVPQPPPPPKLDKAALRQALAERAKEVAAASAISNATERQQALAAIAPIPGATLNNGSISLQIRRS